MVRLEIRSFTKTTVGAVKLRSLTGRTLRYSKRSFGPGVSLSLVFVGDKRMQNLNKKYRGKNKTTDVISFGFLGDRARMPQDLLGEIFISIPQAKRQARAFSHSLQKEVEHLFVHGVLHILGYEHGRSREASSMRRLEEKILGSIHVS